MPQPLRFISPLHKAQRQIGEYLKQDCEAVGIEPGEGHVLSYVSHYGPCPIGELATVFGHKPSTLTGMLDRLEERALVSRAPNPADRRSVLIAATESGRETQAELRDRLVAVEREIADRVSTRDIDGFVAVMGAIAGVTGVALTERDERGTEPGKQSGSNTPLNARRQA